MSQDNTDIEYLAVKNHEEQHSVWDASRPLPEGWTATGFKGTREACLEHIETVWTDMRPLSLRKSMDQDGGVSQ